MLRRGHAFLIGMAAVLTMLLVPATFTTEAAPTPCADVFFTIEYTDPVGGGTVTLFDDSSAKFGVPVGVELTFNIFPDYSKVGLRGKEVKFSSPNQFLTFDQTSESDSAGGNFTYKQNLPNDRPNVNWQLIWKKGDVDNAGLPNPAAGADGVLSFQATIDPANVIDPVTGGELAKGGLMTIGVQIAGARCGAKIEIYGTPGGGGGPGPIPCPGIVVDIYYEANDGKFYPVINNVQGSNTQFSGPSLGNNVLYVITPLGQSNQPVVFDKILHHVDKFFRQNTVAGGTKSDPAGVANTIQNGTVSFVFWNKNSNTWNGQTLFIKTVTKSVGLDTTTFISKLSPNGASVGLCSVHKEVRISLEEFGPNGTAYPDPFAP